MAASSKPSPVKFRKTSPPGTGVYEVIHKDRVIGTVGRFRLGAGQFGSRWMATTPAGQRSGQYATRDAAADWLIGKTR